MFTEIANYLYNNKGHSYFGPEDIFLLSTKTTQLVSLLLKNSSKS